MPKPTLKERLAKWKPPPIEASRKPKGIMGRRFPESVAKLRAGGHRKR